MSSFRRIIEALQLKGFGGMGDYPASFAGIVECILAAPGGGGGGISLTSLSANTPLQYNNTSGVFSIPAATSSVAGHMTAAAMTKLDSLKSNIIGSATFVGSSPVTGVTTEAQLHSFTIPGGTLSKTGDVLEILFGFNISGSGGTKTARLRTTDINGTILHAPSITATNTTSASNRRIIYSGASSGLVGPPAIATTDGGGGGGTFSTLSIDWSIAQTFVITGQLISATDTLELLYCIPRVFS